MLVFKQLHQWGRPSAYSTFKAVFIRECLRGETLVRERINKATLACWKSRVFLDQSSDVAILKVIRDTIYEEGTAWLEDFGQIPSGLNYKLDELHGICEDGSINRIRVISSGKIVKVKIGKFFGDMLEGMISRGELPPIPEAAKVLCRQALEEEYCANRVKSAFNLVVDKDFKAAYSPYIGGSCMAGKEFWRYYTRCINASCARLYQNGELVGRCVIYNDVQGGPQDHLRLAEKVYADDDSYWHVLIALLKHGGYIDGYKKFGSSCHDANAFVLNDGTSLEECTLSIENHFNERKDAFSYQDSFKWYVPDERRSYNVRPCGPRIDMDTTAGSHWINIPTWYDELNCFASAHKVYSAHYDAYIPSNLVWHDDYLDDYFLLGYDRFVVTKRGNQILKSRAIQIGSEWYAPTEVGIDYITQKWVQKEILEMHPLLQVPVLCPPFRDKEYKKVLQIMVSKLYNKPCTYMLADKVGSLFKDFIV